MANMLKLEEPVLVSDILKTVQLSALEGGKRDQIDSKRTKSSGVKVVGTIGMNSKDVDTLRELLLAGMTVARFDFSSPTDLRDHLQTLANLHQAMRESQCPCAVMLDNKGPEVGIVLEPDDNIHIRAGQLLTLTTDKCKASSACIPVSNRMMCEVLQPGDQIDFAQYLIRGDNRALMLEVTEVQETLVKCKALDDIDISGENMYHVHMPGCSAIPALTLEDKETMRAWVNEAGMFDFLSLSFVRDAEDVRQAKAFLEEIGLGEVHVIAKIENLSGFLLSLTEKMEGRTTGLRELDAILTIADGIILARGSLGTVVSSDRMFRVQKYVLAKCNALAKPVIVNRVCDSMTDNPRPTRAEATDVANAVLDGADAILLGSETLRGNCAVECVSAVVAICAEAERVYDHTAQYELIMSQMGDQKFSQLEGLASSAVRATVISGAKLIVLFSSTGQTSRIVAKYRPPVPIMSVVVPRLIIDGIKWKFMGEQTFKRSCLVRGLVPIRADPNKLHDHDPTETEMSHEHGTMLQDALNVAAERGMLSFGEKAVVVQRLGQSSVVKIVQL